MAAESAEHLAGGCPCGLSLFHKDECRGGPPDGGYALLLWSWGRTEAMSCSAIQQAAYWNCRNDLRQHIESLAAPKVAQLLDKIDDILAEFGDETEQALAVLAEFTGLYHHHMAGRRDCEY